MSVSRVTPPERRTPQGAPAGIIDTISDAVTFVIQRPWMMVVPLIVDIILWLFLHVTLGPVIESLIELLETTNVEGSAVVIDELRATSDQIMISDYLGAFVPGLFTGIPLDTVLGALMLFIAPDGFGIPRTDMYQNWANGAIDIIVPESAAMVLGVFILSLLGSSIALIAFRVPMARAIRATHPTDALSEMANSWMHFILYLLILFVGGCVAMIPLALMAALVPITGLSITFVFSFAVLILGGMVGIYSYFVVDAMLIHRTTPINGFRMSYAVSRAYFAQTMRFALTCIFLMLATMSLWSQIASSAPGMIISLLGSAFIGTVLAAASMFFYTDRFRIVRALELGNRNRLQPQHRATPGNRQE
ncbi:MAG: hypothetical protein M9953_04140 [Thermomicrobiales bacterium]|nr:hypothetical protein [Thermomicrobiales bacterium]